MFVASHRQRLEKGPRLLQRWTGQYLDVANQSVEIQSFTELAEFSDNRGHIPQGGQVARASALLHCDGHAIAWHCMFSRVLAKSGMADIGVSKSPVQWDQSALALH
jgi:hypothetical protein